MNRNKATSKPEDLFGQPLLKEQVIIPEQFSLDTNVVPNKEFVYSFISEYARDKYFAPLKLSGPATLKIVAITDSVKNKQLIEAAGKQQDAIATVAALHNILIANPHSLDKFKDYEAIIIPVSSILPSEGSLLTLSTIGDFFCLNLSWIVDDDGWYLEVEGIESWWGYSWVKGQLFYNVVVAIVL